MVRISSYHTNDGSRRHGRSHTPGSQNPQGQSSRGSYPRFDGDFVIPEFLRRNPQAMRDMAQVMQHMANEEEGGSNFTGETPRTETTTASSRSHAHRDNRRSAPPTAHHSPSDRTPIGSQARGPTPIGHHFQYAERENTRTRQRHWDRDYTDMKAPPPPPLTAQEEEMAEMRRQMNEMRDQMKGRLYNLPQFSWELLPLSLGNSCTQTSKGVPSHRLAKSMTGWEIPMCI
ncbi:unnamed protein product [Cuscuta europaea]|uniref:Uncharacterized protein n=1 Tax=Cuscuta europaea TaxID=41803 RepID=A0A9P0ZLY9_CUSEU|nr:unnamed protein product [Cuscuta europaea]